MKVTADDIAQLLAGAPPRRVPAHVTRAARQQQAPGLFGAVGLGFMLIGGFMAGLIFPTRLWDEWRLANRGSETTPGIVTAVTPSNLTINKRRVMETTFAYTPPGERRHTAECYSTGSRWSVGEKVTVHYLRQDSAVACLEGGRLDQGGWLGVLILLAPLGGGVAFGLFVRQYRAVGRLLTGGSVTEVDVLKVEPTGTRVNRQMVYRITLSAPGAPSGTLAVKRTSPGQVDLARRQAEQKQPVFVLYDPLKPAQLIFPEGLIER